MVKKTCGDEDLMALAGLLVVAFTSGDAANGHMREVEGRRRRPCKAGEGAARGKRREEGGGADAVEEEAWE